MHFYLEFEISNHTGMLDLLLMETILVATENPVALLPQSQIWLIRAEAGPSEICDHNTENDTFLGAHVRHVTFATRQPKHIDNVSHGNHF